ncbi:MAG: riboflavin biosynthesis protein RibF [Caldilineae bacterium]|nr:MAG: riboflavin biosynthesis protein RibF [Caldilineae bacterium]
MQVLRPNQPVQLLSSPEERLDLAEALGIQVGVIQTFDRTFAQLSAREFVQLLVDHLGLARLVVGPDFALGRDRAGDIPTLVQLGQELGFDVSVLSPVDLEGDEVRSFVVRRTIAQGDVARARDFLGRCYCVVGEVVHGDGRGRTIGIPTANLQVPPERLLPGDGVYATWTRLGTDPDAPRLASVTNIGVRPTVNGHRRQVETHIFDFPPAGQSGDLYGQTLVLEFVRRLRGEKRFESLDALVAQIHKDMDAARSVLAQDLADGRRKTEDEGQRTEDV